MKNTFCGAFSCFCGKKYVPPDERWYGYDGNEAGNGYIFGRQNGNLSSRDAYLGG